MNIEITIPLFLSFRKAEGLSERTLRDYREHIAAFRRHVPGGTDDYRTAVLAYLSAAKSPNTFNLRFAYLKKFFDWCIDEGLMDCPHPLAGLKKRKPVGRVVHIENDVLSALLALPDQKTFSGLRDYALMLFSLDCGARPGESLQLHRGDFNFAGLLVTIPAPVSKTRQPRTIPITSQTVQAVVRLTDAHHAKWKNAPTFCTENGTRFKEHSWYHRLQEYNEKLGTSITPYHLRHVAALGMLRGGMSAFALRDMLGHANISTTQKYLALTLDDLRREHGESNLIDSIAPKRYRMRKV